ncbi:MAG: FG-GAP repeat domain-containing protein, partial [Planctomycetota bacterium]
MGPHMKSRAALVSLVLTLCLLAAATAAGGEDRPAGPEQAPKPLYFLGPHLFPFEASIGGLIPHDMNGDGRADLILADARASKFHILLQVEPGREGPAEEREEGAEPEANELGPDRLLEREEVRINQHVMDYLDERELIIQRRGEDGSYETAQRFLLDLDSSFSGGFEAADLDGNGMMDAVFLAQDSVLVLFQDEEGRLAEPRRYPIAQEKSVGLVLADADSDGRPDLIYRAPGTRYPLRIRLTQPDGSPGPEYRFRMPPPRDVALGDCTGDGRNEIALIESTTNRVKVLRWQVQREAPLRGTETAALELVPFARDPKAKLRSVAVADVDGNGLPDLVLTEPDAARMTVVRSKEGAGLLPFESFPSLEEATALVALRTPDG